MSAKHQSAAWRRTARLVTAPAYADPGYRCPYPECGRTLAELRQEDPRIKWDACHPDWRVPGRALFPGCSRCNRSAGASDGNRSRNPTSRDW